MQAAYYGQAPPVAAPPQALYGQPQPVLYQAPQQLVQAPPQQQPPQLLQPQQQQPQAVAPQAYYVAAPPQAPPQVRGAGWGGVGWDEEVGAEYGAVFLVIFESQKGLHVVSESRHKW